MNITYIREFLTLIEHRSYASAAQELYISQPTLSRHVSALEREVGDRLLDRQPNALALTTSGETAVQGFRVIVQHIDDLQAQVEGKV